ncbi:MAG: hypothetical protein Q4P71_05270 [Actinomycetaceae bacterium]|nr:hypothetical protein [Actinomycetaceae bacterium]
MSEDQHQVEPDDAENYSDLFTEEEPTRHEPIDDVYGPSTVIAAIDQIEDLVESARALPMSASILLNKAEMLDLLDQARQALPEDLLAADAVVADADALLVRADDVAESTVQEAKLRAQSIVDDARTQADELGQRSREDAERTIQQAKEEAHALVQEAHERAEMLIDQQQVTAQARERAEEIVRNAHDQAQKLTEGADKYCAESLATLSETLDRIHHQTRAGQEAIEKRRSGR